MSTTRIGLRSLLAEVMTTQSVPGIVLATARSGFEPSFIALGTDASGIHLREDSLFPVASLTKLAVALAILRLVAQDRLSLDDGLAVHLPDAASARDAVTIRRLLSHTAGLPDDLAPESAPYRIGLNWTALGHACLQTDLSHPPLTQVRYSNVGYGLLALIVERLTEKPFSLALHDLVCQPLAIEAYLGQEPPRPPVRLAGALGDHAGTKLEPFNSPFWRSLALPWGGMLTTVSGALALVRALNGEPKDFLPQLLREEAVTDQTQSLPGGMHPKVNAPTYPWGLGPEVRGVKSPHWTPPEAGAASFGHAGASGCLAWVSPDEELAWAFFGTRTFETWWRRWTEIGSAIIAPQP